MHNTGIQKFVNRAEAAAAQNDLPTDLRIATAHEAEELDLLFGVRREIRMPAFGRHNAVARSVPNKNGLAQTGAGRKQSARPAKFRLAWIQDAIFFGLKMLDAVSSGAEIVHQHDLGKF